MHTFSRVVLRAIYMGKESKMDKDMNDLKDKEAGEKDRDPGGLNKKPKLKALNP